MNVWSRYLLALSTISTVILGPFVACAESDTQSTSDDAGQLNFGLTGSRRRLPHLQHLLTYLDDSLVELET